jgi:hypothetical protein
MSGITGIIALIVMGVFWFILTVFILCIMEVSWLPKYLIDHADCYRFARACPRSCMRFDYTGSRQTASTMKLVDM